MDSHSSSASRSHASGSASRFNVHLTSQELEALRRPLTDTPHFPFTAIEDVETQNPDFYASSEPATIGHIPASSPEVSTSTKPSKSEVWKYFDKITVDGARKAKCKICPNVIYAFPQSTGTNPLSRHIKTKYPDKPK